MARLLCARDGAGRRAGPTYTIIYFLPLRAATTKTTEFQFRQIVLEQFKTITDLFAGNRRLLLI